MNFKKKSIFHRGANDEPEQEVQAENGGMLAVWGSPGSGKTVAAVKLAKALADKKKNVALLLCDMTAPMLPCICPPSELECERSLGGILAVPHMSDALIKNNCVIGGIPRYREAQLALSSCLGHQSIDAALFTCRRQLL